MSLELFSNSDTELLKAHLNVVKHMQCSRHFRFLFVYTSATRDLQPHLFVDVFKQFLRL